MTPEHWQSVLARLGTEQPADIGAELSTKALPRRGAGLSVWSEETTAPSPRLWDRSEYDASYIGVRIDGSFHGSEISIALRLASAALERGVSPVILAIGEGAVFLERFGFRVERFVGDDAEAQSAWEEEMSAFWNLALIIDARDVAALG